MKRECTIDTSGYYNYTPRSDTTQEILSVRVYPYCCYPLPRYVHPIVLPDFNAFPSPHLATIIISSPYFRLATTTLES